MYYIYFHKQIRKLKFVPTLMVITILMMITKILPEIESSRKKGWGMAYLNKGGGGMGICKLIDSTSSARRGNFLLETIWHCLSSFRKFERGCQSLLGRPGGWVYNVCYISKIVSLLLCLFIF